MRGNTQDNTTRKFIVFRTKDEEMNNRGQKHMKHRDRRGNNKVSVLIPAAGQSAFI